MECLPEGVKIEQVDICLQDEARFGQKEHLHVYMGLKGTRPRLTRQQQFEYAYIFVRFVRLEMKQSVL